MSELGQLLKNARLEKGYTLEDVQDITKIRKHYLEAIEEGNFKALPGNFYVRAFIKTYAETVGLDPEETLGLHKNVIPSSVQEPQHDTVIRKRKRSDSDTEKVGKLASSALMWLFPILIIGIIYYFFVVNYDGNKQVKQPEGENITNSKQEPVVEDTPNAGNGTAQGSNNANKGTSTDGTTGNANAVEPGTEEGIAGEVPPEGAVTDPNTLPAQEAGVVFDAKKGKTDNYNIAGATAITVELTVAEGKECWYEVREGNSDGKQLDTGTLRNASTVTVASDKDTFIKVGNAGNVQIKVNGVLVDDGDKPNSKRLQMNFATAASAPTP
ncbi:RodZ domain-containing protein [Paenibacillus swuensis]|uniref:RodZ domain-containing protein n=1 Tax=Paenibacillus swuensis TaxID=1178515 RepID=UPI0008391FDF|nr:RodZ domain-containing protein [Paenibacillus swuensis]